MAFIKVVQIILGRNYLNIPNLLLKDTIYTKIGTSFVSKNPLKAHKNT